MAHDVFISFSTKDKAVADAVCAALEQAKIRCWIAPRDILPGHQWAESISKALTSSRVMVLVFSSDSNNSKQVKKELSIAINENVIVIPFKIEDVRLEGVMKYYLADTHWLDAVNPPTDKQIKDLAETVGIFIKGEGGITGDKKPETIDVPQYEPDQTALKSEKPKKSGPLLIGAAVLMIAAAVFTFTVISKSGDSVPNTSRDNAKKDSVPAQTVYSPVPAALSDVQKDAVNKQNPVKQNSFTPTNVSPVGKPQSQISSNGTPAIETTGVSNEAIYFPDKELEAAIRDVIKKPSGNILKSDVRDITTLSIENRYIKNIEGIQHFSSLRTLSLMGNMVTEINILKQLRNLKSLNLSANKFNISELQGFSGLRSLSIVGCSITDSDMNVLRGLTSLNYLLLSWNYISDISALKNLTQLDTLYFDNNKVGDISPLKGLTNLSVLHIQANPIVDYSPLDELKNIRELKK